MTIKKALKISLVIVPVLLWDMFYYVFEKIWDVVEYIDEEGGMLVADFLREE